MCVLRVHGEDFDVDRFLVESSLEPYEVYRRGERRFPKSTRNKECNEYSGLKINVSDKGWDDLTGQIDDAILFLDTNSAALEQLVAFPNVDRLTLDFPVDLRIDGTTIVGQSDFLPPSLLKLAGTIGIWIELSLYSTKESI